jgi:ParB family transcriptional regulator, chromosome partitioning protein
LAQGRRGGRERLMTTTAADKADKVEKRRALGRGLESLLPGPRVVAGTSPTFVKNTNDGAPGTGGPGQGEGAAGEQQVPFDSAAPGGATALRAGSHFVRNDKPFNTEQVVEIQAVAEEELTAGAGAGAEFESPLLAKDARNGAPGFGGGAGTRAEPALSLSKGVSAPHETISIQAVAETRAPSNLVVSIPLDHIDKNPYQTRYLFDQELLEELADSIRANGVVQPVLVRPGEVEGRYVLILGERRCRASKLAGKTTIPAMVKRVSEQQAAEMTVIENLQRQDLNCLEQAEAFRVLSKEFNLTQAQIGERVGLSRESVSNYMRLLKLKQSTMEYLTGGALSFTDARLLLALEDPEVIANAADEAVEKHLTGEMIEDLVLRIQGFLPRKPGQQPPKPGGARWVDPNVKAAQAELERLLGVRVRIRDRKGKGKIVIEYHTVDDFERVVEALRRKK